MTYKRHPQAEARRRSAVALIKLLLSDSQELLPTHRHAASAEKVDETLSAAIGCTITREEHHRLNEFRHLDGWKRYSEAVIVVIIPKGRSGFSS